jgi:hypothetical protein
MMNLLIHVTVVAGAWMILGITVAMSLGVAAGHRDDIL